MSTKKLSPQAVRRLRWHAGERTSDTIYVTGGGAAATDRGLECRGFIKFDGRISLVITEEGRTFLAALAAR